MACNCPVATALTTITATGCPEEIGQIQRAWFVRKGEVIWDTDAGGLALNNVPAGIIGDVVEVIAGWNTLKIAPDSTKVVFAPLFGGDITIAPAEAITQGGN